MEADKPDESADMVRERSRVAGGEGIVAVADEVVGDD